MSAVGCERIAINKVDPTTMILLQPPCGEVPTAIDRIQLSTGKVPGNRRGVQQALREVVDINVCPALQRIQ